MSVVNWKNLIAIIVGAALYNLASISAIGLSLALPVPSWWIADHSIWPLVAHTLGMFALSIPFALLIHASRLSSPILVAFAIAFFGLVLPAAFETAPLVARASSYHLLTIVLDNVKFMTTLPLLVWLIARVSSNYSFKRTAAPKVE
jgi:hypothetical protein